MAFWKISVDTGGTFTDCSGVSPDGSIHRTKVLSSSRLRARLTKGSSSSTVGYTGPWSYPEGFLEGYEFRIGEEFSCEIIKDYGIRRGFELSQPLPEFETGTLFEIVSREEAPLFAIRCLTSTPLRDELPPLELRLGTTRATNALLENKGAPVLLLVTRGFGDLCRIRDQKRPELFARHIVKPEPSHRAVIEVDERMSAEGEILRKLQLDGLDASVRSARDEDGCRVAAVSLLNSYANREHEQILCEWLKGYGFDKVISAREVSPFIKYLERTETGMINATLAPIMEAYLDAVEKPLESDSLRIMTSAGGLVPRRRFLPVDSLLSGPAGGVMGAVTAGRRCGWSRVLTLDMGGTSTDVSRWTGEPLLQSTHQVGNARIASTALRLETVAAGGGSCCGFDGERLYVGPESAGADPGPAAYGACGPLTLTDVHLILGRLDPAAFSIPVNFEAARNAMDAVVREVGEGTAESIAEGFLEIANERMAQAIRAVSLRDGEDPASFGLVSFGGAGGLHACAIAEMLGVSEITFPSDAGILSAVGLEQSVFESIQEQQILGLLEETDSGLSSVFATLVNSGTEALVEDGVPPDEIDVVERKVFLRLHGQESTLSVDWEPGISLCDAFTKKFQKVFGYFPEEPRIETVRSRARVVSREAPVEPEVYPESTQVAHPQHFQNGFVNGEEVKLPVFDRTELTFGKHVSGPAVLRDAFSAFFLKTGWRAIAGRDGGIRVAKLDTNERGEKERPERVRQELMLHSFESLVEEMGVQLQATALSPNIRERLDYSCALLDREGRLLVNAPHIPVHLGAMGVCVRAVIRDHKFEPGDVLVTNHPAIGGSHLPDITVMCGVFDEDAHLIGYLANRAHHAELGGSRPGSMPPFAKSLAEEGVVISPFWLIRDGISHHDVFQKLLGSGAYPSRGIEENMADLQAQVAALRRGVQLFEGLLHKNGSEPVLKYLDAVYELGRSAFLRRIQSVGSLDAEASDCMDDGSTIVLKISKNENSLRFDFSGTANTHAGNLNATPAIVRSAVLYCIRLWIQEDIPLNEGLLENVHIELPAGMLNPSFSEDPRECPAVVGGNVETSQRVVDVVLQALNVQACGQGTMNNFLLGSERFGYYETIGGGSGAGQGYPGADGVHVNMTNTAITDAEILEYRFPVLCNQFSIRGNSGGEGKWQGGNGLVREFTFLEALDVSILSQRRLIQPPGMAGGGCGKPGKQEIKRVGEDWEPLKGIDAVTVNTGDRIRIETPGGGGCGGGAGND